MRPHPTRTAVVACLFLLGTFLAGCAGSEDPQQEGSVGGGASPTPTATPTENGPTPTPDGTEEPGPETNGSANEPPTAQLTADITEAEAPADIDFTIDASDEDGDELTWTLDVDGDGEPEADGTGTDLPFTYTHTFQDAGNFTAMLVVSDGQEEAEAERPVRITEPEGGGFQPIDATGSVLLPCLHCIETVTLCVGLLADENEVSCFWMDLPEEAEGRTATVEGSYGYVSYSLLSECSTSGTELGGDIDVTGEATFEIPDGAGCLVLYETIDPLVDYTIRIE